MNGLAFTCTGNLDIILKLTEHYSRTNVFHTLEVTRQKTAITGRKFSMAQCMLGLPRSSRTPNLVENDKSYLDEVSKPCICLVFCINYIKALESQS
uniref:Uncharacterized protein n=1 Tax=Pinctada fucata TaxID=50426 RepID=A0A194APT5_PINFU